MHTVIDIWHHRLTTQTGLEPRTIHAYVQDVQRCATWLCQERHCQQWDEVAADDVKAYRDACMQAGRSPATINRALISLTRFWDAMGYAHPNPLCVVGRIAVVEHAPQALSAAEWNAVQRQARAREPRDQGCKNLCVKTAIGLKPG